MIEILDLSNETDIKKLKDFSMLDHPSTFRYFKNRVFEEAIKTHSVTLLYSAYGYAHIDKDIESGRYYLGICVMPEYQGKGIGTKLIEFLLKLHTDELYLSVDKTNTSAIRLYEKYQFKRIDETDKSYLYKLQKSLVLDVSIGEAIDKLTILDIKLEKINDSNKKEHCQKEYNSIHTSLKNYLDSCSRFYTWLKYINLQIWNLQDEMREKNNYSKETFHKILDLNDMRFRVKKRINSMFDSSLQEQKGYSNKNGIFLTHLGMGDLINMNGAIRYASLMVDTLYVISKKCNAKNVREMLADDTSIFIVECKNDDSDILSNINFIKSSVNITHTFNSGFHCGRNTFNNIPFDFYDDLHFSWDIKNIFAHFNTYCRLPVPSIPYIFTHTSSSNGTTNIKYTWNKDDILTIDPNKNMYDPSHTWYNLAEIYLNKPIFSYFDVIKNAKEIHVTDSSFYCLSTFTNPIATIKLCYDRTTGAILSKYKFQ